VRLDPRALILAAAALLLGILLGGPAGLLAGTGAAVALAIAGRGTLGAYARPLATVAPLALFVAALDALAGRAPEGALAAARLLAVTLLALALARRAEPRRITDGLLALHLPYALVFVLVTGARFVPVATTDLAELRDAAVLRGIGLGGTAWERFAGWRAILVPLLVVTIRRGLQLGEAMEARGFSSAARRTSHVDLRWRARDSLALALAAGYLAAVLTVR